MSVKLAQQPCYGSPFPDGMQQNQSPPLLARTGRHRQRYGAGGERLVAGCIPVKVHSPSGIVERVEVCLISSRAGRGFSFPKGGWEDDEDVHQAAQRETVEEAGLRGTLEEPMVGVFHFQSAKADAQESSVHQGRCIAHMFVMHVEEELDAWPEGHERQRVWCSLSEAASRCRHEWMRNALLMWVRHHNWEHLLPAALLSHCTHSSSSQAQGPTSSCVVMVGAGMGTAHTTLTTTTMTTMSSDLSDTSDSVDLSRKSVRS